MISNVKSDGTLWPSQSEEGLFLKGNTGWHTDSSFKQYPAKASILAAHKVPTQGGGTEFADMRAAYDALKPNMRDWLEGKLTVHSFIYSPRINRRITCFDKRRGFSSKKRNRIDRKRNPK